MDCAIICYISDTALRFVPPGSRFKLETIQPTSTVVRAIVIPTVQSEVGPSTPANLEVHLGAKRPLTGQPRILTPDLTCA